MDSKELQKIIKLARKNGIKHLKIDGVELNFVEEAVIKEKKITIEDSSIETTPKYTDMDYLLWSVQDTGQQEN